MTEESTKEVEEYLNKIAQNLAYEKGDYPEPPDKDNLLKVFRSIMGEQGWLPSLRTGNLEKEEIGRPNKPVRTYLSVARFCEAMGNMTVAEYLRGYTTDLSASSLAKKAKLLEMPFTVKRESRSFGAPRTTTKRGWLGGETTVKENLEE